MSSAALSREQLAVNHMEATQTRIAPLNQQPLRLLSLEDMEPVNLRETVRETLRHQTKDHSTSDTPEQMIDETKADNQNAANEHEDKVITGVFGKLSPAANAAQRLQPRDADIFQKTAPKHAYAREIWVGAGLVTLVLAINLGLASASSDGDREIEATTTESLSQNNNASLPTLPDVSDVPSVSPQPRSDFASAAEEVSLPPAAPIATAPEANQPASQESGITSLAAPKYITQPPAYPSAKTTKPVNYAVSTTPSTLPSRAAVQELLTILKK